MFIVSCAVSVWWLLGLLPRQTQEYLRRSLIGKLAEKTDRLVTWLYQKVGGDQTFH